MVRGELLYNKLRRRYADLQPFEEATEAARLAFSEVENEVMNEIATQITHIWRQREETIRPQIKVWYDAYCMLKAQQENTPEDPRIQKLQRLLDIEKRAYAAKERECWGLENKIDELKRENRRLSKIRPTSFKAPPPHAIFFLKPEFFPRLTEDQIFQTRTHDPLEELILGVEEGLATTSP
jgi:hypothetical protein